MLRNPLGKWLWDNRRSILGWTVAIAAVGAGYAAFWPTIDDPGLQELIANYPDALMEAINYTDIATAAGYLNATVYGLIVAMLLVVYGTASGTRMIAGDEDAGTLDLILVHPIGRARLAIERFLAFVVSVTAMSVALLFTILLIAKPFSLDTIPIGGLVAMHLHVILFGSLFGAVAFSVGAASGRRALALAVGAGVAVFGFAANGILPQVDGLGWIDNLSPFNWLNGGTPLTDGVQWTDVGTMALLSVALVSVGAWGFARRDIGV